MYNSILVPIDLGQIEQGKNITRIARKLLDMPGGQLTLLNVVPDIPGYVLSEMPEDIISKTRSSSLERLEEIASECGVDDVSKIVVHQGNIYHEILSSASDLGADLIVMASHQPEFTDYLIGSTTARVVRHAECSVFVVRHHET